MPRAIADTDAAPNISNDNDDADDDTKASDFDTVLATEAASTLIPTEPALSRSRAMRAFVRSGGGTVTRADAECERCSANDGDDDDDDDDDGASGSEEDEDDDDSVFL